MKAFVGHSFDDKDSPLIEKIISFLNKRGILCESGEKAENKSVSEKVKERIDRNDIFIGIFTIDKGIKQLPSNPNTIQSSSRFKWFKRKKGALAINKVVPIFTTSNWVIQESGYAIAKKKKEDIIMMVEYGVHKFPELQGDKEIVLFDRNSLDSALLKLSEFIQGSNVGAKVISQKTSGEMPEENANDVGEKEEPNSLPWKEMVDAHDKGDLAEVERIYKSKIRNELEPESATLWDAIINRWKYCSGDVKALSELERMAQETKNCDVAKQLAFCYEFTDKHNRAREQYSKCIALSKNSEEKVICLIDISASYAKEKKYDLAIDCLLNAANHMDYVKYLEKIFVKLTEIAKMKEDNYLYTLFAEKTLAINPVNTTLRFNLGLKYLDLNKNDLAVYHYKKLLHIQESSGSLNNIAIGYAALNLKAKEAHYLRKAVEKKDDTLPYANISQKYINEGFTDDADKLLSEADELGGKKIEVVARVGIAKNRLKEMLKDEEKKEKEMLELAEQVHSFKIKQGNAYYLKNSTIDVLTLSGIWIMEKWGEVTINFNMVNKTFEGSAQSRIDCSPTNYPGLGLLMGLGADASLQAKEYKIRKVKINGVINELAGNYTIKVTEEKEGAGGDLGRSLLLGPYPDEIYSANGSWMIVDNTNVDVMEEDSKNNRLFSKWRKK